MASERQVVLKKIESAQKMKTLMADYFYELDRAARSPEEKVAWCTSVGPAELLRAFGFKVYFPENHGAMLGATRMATDLIPVANAIGYSPDVCSYLTSDVGSYLRHETPLSKAYPGVTSVPRPDVMVYNTNQCRDVQEWFQFFQREFDVPAFGIISPRGMREVTADQVAFVSRQMQDLIHPLEEISGNEFDSEKLKESLLLSKRCVDLWKEVLHTATHRPSPLTFFDGTIHMGPAVVLRGDPRAVDYYEALLGELRERVKGRVAAVEGEKLRLYWEGMPIWGKLREHAELFAHHQACVLASTYCNSWVFEAFDPQNPFDSMARAYLEIFIVRSEPFKEEYIQRMVQAFQIDGIIFHDSKSCPNNSNNRYGLPERLFRKRGLPYVVIPGDLNDLRCYSEEQGRTQIEAFIEQLNQR